MSLEHAPTSRDDAERESPDLWSLWEEQPTAQGGTSTDATRSSSLAAIEGQRITGQVRSFDGKWGFATSDRFQGDIFVGTACNPDMGGPLKRGDTIEFTVQRSSSNKSQTGFEAVDVQVTERAPQDEIG